MSTVKVVQVLRVLTNASTCAMRNGGASTTLQRDRTKSVGNAVSQTKVMDEMETAACLPTVDRSYFSP